MDGKNLPQGRKEVGHRGFKEFTAKTQRSRRDAKLKWCCGWEEFTAKVAEGRKGLGWEVVDDSFDAVCEADIMEIDEES